MLLAAAACGSNPSTPSASVTAPGPLLPSNGAQIQNAAQPVTLVVTNAVATSSSGATTYTFEVATDTGFATRCRPKDGVAEGSSQTA